MGHSPQHEHTELNQCAFSSYLNVVATATTTGSGEFHLHVWDFENCKLNGTCVHPQARSGESYEVGALAMLSPKPFLLGSLSNGIIPIWSVLNCVCKLTLVPTTDVEDQWVDTESVLESASSVITITSLCVYNVEKNDDGEASQEQTVFASDEKGFVFAWKLTANVFPEKRVPSRRSSTFNPHRIVKTRLGGDEMTYYRVNARKAQSRNVRARAPSFHWKAHDDSIVHIESMANLSR